MVIPPYCDQVAKLHIEDAERDLPDVQSKNMVQAVKRARIESEADFDQLMLLGQPFVMEGLDLGECMTDWTVDKLVQKINPERLVRNSSNSIPAPELIQVRSPSIKPRVAT